MTMRQAARGGHPRLNKVADGMQLAVEVQRTDEGAAGLPEGVIPHEIGRCGEAFSHH